MFDYIRPEVPKAFFTADIVICHSRENPGGTNNSDSIEAMIAMFLVTGANCFSPLI